MAEEIDDTGDLTGGAYQIPSASDSGSEVFNILETFMKRMAVHKHDGTDALVINKKVDKTIYKAGDEVTGDSTDSWTATGIAGNHYITIDVADSELQLVDGEGDVNDITRQFFYLDTNLAVDGVDGHVEFFPDLEWQTKSEVRVVTNIKDTIIAANGGAGVGVVYMKAF